jgi:hypothetical protein
VALCSLEGSPRRSLTISGGYGEGETPLPIPNRAVKPLSADGTWLARAWESRSPPVYLSASPARRRGSLLFVPAVGRSRPGRAAEPHPIRRDSRACRVPAGCVICRSASQRQRRPASSRPQGADRTSGVMQCCGRASTAPGRRGAGERHDCVRCGWDARVSTSSWASSSVGSRSRAARARSTARWTARSEACGCGLRQNTCSYGASAIGWNGRTAALPGLALSRIGPVERKTWRGLARLIAERVFVSGGSDGPFGAGSGCGRVGV